MKRMMLLRKHVKGKPMTKMESEGLYNSSFIDYHYPSCIGLLQSSSVHIPISSEQVRLSLYQ